MGFRKKLPFIRSERRAVRWFGYAVYLFAILIILGAIFGENNGYTPSKTYSCPAEKYMLTGSDFDESRWIVGENTDELPSKLQGLASDYQCYKVGKVRKDLDVLKYVIFVYGDKETAKSEYNKIKENYVSKMSIKELRLGNEGFKADYGVVSLYGHEGHVIWIWNGNSLIYITSSVIVEDPVDLAKLIITKMNSVE